MLGRTKTRTRDRTSCQTIRTVRTSPEMFEQELRPAVCEHQETDLRRIIVKKWVFCLTLDCNGIFAIKAYKECTMISILLC